MMNKHTSYQADNLKIRELREKKGLSQDDLANAAGISKTSVYNIEHKRTNPQPTTLRRIADALNVQIDDITTIQFSFSISEKHNNASVSAQLADNDDIDEVLAHDVYGRLNSINSMYDDIISKSDMVRDGTLPPDGALIVYPSYLDVFLLKTPQNTSLTELSSNAISYVSSLGRYPAILNNVDDLIHCVGNVLFNLPRDILLEHIDREREWTNLINTIEMNDSLHRWAVRLSNMRFSSIENRVTLLLKLYFYIAEHMNDMENKPASLHILSLICCLFENKQIEANDLIALDMASRISFDFMYTLHETNFDISRDQGMQGD